MNGANCTNYAGSGTNCNCINNYSGLGCLIKTCANANTCKNGATCSNVNGGGITCSCTAGWVGVNCDQSKY